MLHVQSTIPLRAPPANTPLQCHMFDETSAISDETSYAPSDQHISESLCNRCTIHREDFHTMFYLSRRVPQTTMCSHEPLLITAKNSRKLFKGAYPDASAVASCSDFMVHNSFVSQSKSLSLVCKQRARFQQVQRLRLSS